MKIKNLIVVVFLIIVFSSADTVKLNILIIGDSISIGYTPFVQSTMANVANVVHNEGNGQASSYGLNNISKWIGTAKWDIIQFNWGLWDLAYRTAGKLDKKTGKLTSTPEAYRANLEAIVQKLLATNAKLIFVTTTYIPSDEPGRNAGDEVIYNDVAVEIMNKYSIKVNDISAYSKSVHENSDFGMGNTNVHYKTAGYELLAVKISDGLKGILEGMKPTESIDKVDNLNLTQKLVPITASAIFRDSMYYQWCSSIIKDEKGIYHLFYSRWPKKVGFNGWLTHSEIAHATATALSGPYAYKETVLKRQNGNKNFICYHNPKIKKFGEKYYLYFISTNNGNEELSEDTLASVAKKGGKHTYWSVLRNNQRTYVAVSNSLNGKWKIVDKALIEPSAPIAHVTVNPDIEQDENGTYFLVVKGDKVNAAKWKLIQVIATSKSPVGPFIIQPKPMFEEISTEDVSIWRDKNNRQFYAIFHAHGGNFIGLLTSPDGLNWVKATDYEVCKKEIRFKDGTILKPDRMERPFVFQENGVPASLSFGVKQGDDAYIVFIPLLGY